MANEFKIKNGLLVESGESQITGSLIAPNITGSLQGTASWASNATTASYVLQAVSSSYALTASYALNAGGGGGAAFPYTGSAVISGSLQVTGSVSSTAGFTGSLQGTASWAQNAVTASYAQTASYGINVTISGSVSNVDYIQFNTASSVTDAVGRLYYDNGEGVLQYTLVNGNVVARIGEDLYQYAYNASGAPMTKGQLVYISGSQGNRIAVKLASNQAELGSSNVLGFVAEAIGTGAEGWVQTNGVLRKVNTVGLTAGQLIFLSSTPCAYTQTFPQAPSHSVRLGFPERIDATVGSIYIKIDNGYETDELHDVAITSASSGDLLVRTGSIWVNKKQLTGSYGLTGSLTAIEGGFTGSLYGTASWAENAITASYVTLAQTASYVTLAQSASYVQQAQSASYVLNAVSSSYAATASSADAFTVRNFLELAPGTDPGTANVSSSYFFVTASSDNTEQNLHFRNNGALWEMHWLEQVTNTGLVWGGILTFTASLTDTPPNRTEMRITPGAGIIVNHNANTGSHGDTTPTYVQFGPITASADFITSSQVTYLLIDENGQLVQQTTKFTPEQYVEKFPLGYIFCLTTSSISSYADARVTTYGQAEQEGEFVRAFGPLKLSGYDITAQSSSLKISIAAGQSYRYGGFYTQNPQSPSIYDSTAVATGSLVRIYRDPSVTGGFKAQTNAGLPFTDIDPTKYDDGSGTLQTVSASQWSIQRVFQGVVNNVSYVYYGQNVYDSLALALQSITTDQFVESPTSILALPFIGYIIARGNTTDLGDTTNNRIIQAGLFRNTAGSSGGGGAAAQNLDDLGDVTITGATNGQALIYNSGLWVNGDPTNATNASTASYVLQAVSASFATTASYVQLAETASYVTLAQTASYIEQAQSASYVLQAVSASFATTASFVATASWATNAVTSYTPIFVTGSTIYSTNPSTGNLSANNSVFLGSSTGGGATGANFSVFVGYKAGQLATSTNESVFVGPLAGLEAVKANGSIFLGSGAGQKAVSASYSTIIGYYAGSTDDPLTSIGTNNIILGNNISLPSKSRDSINIGAIIFATGSYSTLGSGNLYSGSQFGIGRVGINIVTPHYTLDVSGSGNYTNGLTVTGSVIATFGFTGSLQGTSSWAQNSVTASYVLQAVSASFATTASYAANGGVTSFNTRTGAVTLQATDISGLGAGIVSSSTFSSPSQGTLRATINGAQTDVDLGLQTADSVQFAQVTSSFTGSLTGALIGTASWANNAVTASFVTLAQTASFVTTAQTASFVNTAQTASFVATASWAINAVTASFITTAQTASYVLQAVSASFASTASSVNTLNQNVLITNTLTVGITVTGSNENTLILGPKGAQEGGQLLLYPGTSYTSASMLDVYQDSTNPYLRILRGSISSSDSLVAQFNLHTKQFLLPAYNSLGAFSGTPVAALGVDSNGAVITIQTGSQTAGGGVTINNNTDNYILTATGTVNTINGESNLQFNGSTLSVTGNVTATSITASGAVIAQANNAMYFRGGDDAELWDINVANTVGVYGQQDQTIASIKLGSGGGILSGKSGNIGIGTIDPGATLHVQGNVSASSFTGSLFGTSSWALNVVGGAGAAFPYTGSAIISGGLQVTGSVSSTVGFTGSLFGTASWAQNAVTASYILQAVSASFATTASYAANGGVTSFNTRTGAVTLSATDISGLGAGIVSSSTFSSPSQGTLRATINGAQTDVDLGLQTADNVQFAQVTASFTGSLTGALIGTASWATNAVNSNTASFATTAQTASYVLQAVSSSFSSTASRVSSNLTEGTGITAFTYNGSSAQTVAVAGASTLTTNEIVKWNGTAFADSNIFDNGTSVFITASNLIVSGASSALIVTGSVRSSGGFTGSLFGTASWAQNAVTASYVLSTDIFGNLSRIATGSVTASVDTGSFQVVSGSSTLIFVSNSGTILPLNNAELGSTNNRFSAMWVATGTTINSAGTLNLSLNQSTGTAARFNLINNSTSTATSGEQVWSRITNTFAPTTGTATYIHFSLIPTINQTGGANGISRGVYIQPTLTNAFDWRSIEWNNNTGWGIFGAGTAPSHLSGSLTVSSGVTASLFGTSSWAQNTVTASYVTGSIFTADNLALSASFAVSASWAPGGSSGLATKAGSVANTSFTGNPKKATVTFSAAFPNTNYAIVITGEDARTWTIESKVAGSFVINANANTGLAGTTYWVATAYGETA